MAGPRVNRMSARSHPFAFVFAALIVGVGAAFLLSSARGQGEAQPPPPPPVISANNGGVIPVVTPPAPPPAPAITNAGPAPANTTTGRPAPAVVVDGDIVPLLTGGDFVDPSDSDRQDAIEVSPARSAMYEAMVDVQDGMYEEAIPKLEWVIDQDPTLLGAWETLGWAYWLTDRRKDAENLWQRLITIAPNEPMGYNLLAQVATRDGDFTHAEELYQKSLRLNPDQFEVRLNMARVLLWGGKQERAVALLRRLHREDKDRLDVEIDLAWALYVNEEYEDAIEHWDRINEAVPDNPAFLLARANVLMLLGDIDGAEADATKVIAIDPRNIAALNMLAGIAAQSRDPVDAVAALRRVLELTDDKQAQAAIMLRIAAFKKSIIDRDSQLFSLAEVIREVRESIDLDDTKVGAHLYYGEMLAVDKQYGEAEKIFKKVLTDFNSNSYRARYGLVESYFGRAMYDEVEQQLRDNFRLFNSNNPFRHVYWARLHFARGKFTDALKSLEALELEGSQGAVFSLLYHGINPSEFSDAIRAPVA